MHAISPACVQINAAAIQTAVKPTPNIVLNIVSVIAFQFVIVCLKFGTVYQLIFLKTIHLFLFLNKIY